jgi:hypothetical protein
LPRPPEYQNHREAVLIPYLGLRLWTSIPMSLRNSKLEADSWSFQHIWSTEFQKVSYAMTDTNGRIALDHQFITPSPTPRFEVVRLISQLPRTGLCLTFTLSLGKLAGSRIRDTSHAEFIFKLPFNSLRLC